MSFMNDFSIFFHLINISSFHKVNLFQLAVIFVSLSLANSALQTSSLNWCLQWRGSPLNTVILLHGHQFCPIDWQDMNYLILAQAEWNDIVSVLDENIKKQFHVELLHLFLDCFFCSRSLLHLNKNSSTDNLFLSQRHHTISSLLITKNSLFWTHRTNRITKDYTLDNSMFHIVVDRRYETGIKLCRSYSTISSQWSSDQTVNLPWLCLICLLIFGLYSHMTVEIVFVS